MDKIYGAIPSATASGAYERTDYWTSKSEAERRSNKKVERVAARWCKEWQRCGLVVKGGGNSRNDRDIAKKITNIRAGPPAFLDEALKTRWEAEIMASMNRCKETILAPFFKDRLILRWIELRNILWSNIRQERTLGSKSGRDELLAIVRGIKNNISKQRDRIKGEEKDKFEIPPPPRELISDREEERVDEIAVLKRGVEVAPVISKFVVNGERGGSKDPIELIAREIYGCKKREKFIYRNLIKQIDIEESRGVAFESRYVRFKGGGGRKINSFKQYRQILYRQKSRVGKEEFRNIATLYQTQIRIFKEESNTSGSNMTCIHQIGQSYSRTIDLVEERGIWSLVYKAKEHRIEGKDSKVREEAQQEEVKCREGDRREEDKEKNQAVIISKREKEAEVEKEIDDKQKQVGEERRVRKEEDREKQYATREGGGERKREGQHTHKGGEGGGNLDKVDRKIVQIASNTDKKGSRRIIEEETASLRDWVDKNERQGERADSEGKKDDIRETESEGSSIEFVDRWKLEECIQQYIAKKKGNESNELGKEGEDKDSVKIGVGGRDRRNKEESEFKNKKMRGQSQVEEKDIGYSINKEGLEENRETETKENRVGKREHRGASSSRLIEGSCKRGVVIVEGRELLYRELKKVEEGTAWRKGQKERNTKIDEQGLRDSEYSETSSIDLIDARQLEECMEKYRASIQLEEKRKERNEELEPARNRKGGEDIGTIGDKIGIQLDIGSDNRKVDAKEIAQKEGSIKIDEEGLYDSKYSGTSSIDLIDTRQLEECMKQYREKERNRKNEDSDSFRNGNRGREDSGTIGEKIGLSSQSDRSLEERKADSKEIAQKEKTEGGGRKGIGKNSADMTQRRVSRRGKSQEEERVRLYDSSREEIVRGEDKDIGEEAGGNREEEKEISETGEIDSLIEALFRDKELEEKEMHREKHCNSAQSVASSIDLIYAGQLEECMRSHKAREKVDEKSKGAGRELFTTVVNIGREGGRQKKQLRQGELVSREDISNEGMDRITGSWGGGEDGSAQQGIRGSQSTSSSIAVLFRDKHLEREGRRIGRNNITRRKVWLRWKGIIRGQIRRNIRKENKSKRDLERQRTDRKLIFDYTTKGLSEDEVSLLERGEGFCVADYKIDEDRSKVDIYQFQRRLRLHELFRDPGSKEEGEGENIHTPVNRVGNRRSRVDRTQERSIQRIVEEGGAYVANRTRSVSRAIVGSRGVSNIGRRMSTRINNQGTQDSSTRERRTSLTQGRGVDTSNITSIRRASRNRGEIADRQEVDRGVRVSRRVSNSGGNRESIVNSIRMNSTQRRGEGDRVAAQNSTSRTTVRGRTVGNQGVLNTGDRQREGISSVSRIERRRSSTIEGVRTQEERIDMGDRQEVDRLKGEGRRLPSIFDPDSHNRNLNRYNTCIQEEIMLALEDKKSKFKDNISKQERIALKLLKKRIEEKEIIITRADKGSGLVAVDYDKYILKGTKYIEEETGAYSKVTERELDIIGKLTKERNKIAEQLKERGVITLQTATYIRKQLEEKITGIKFYYKIHKDRQIDTMPLRPLQSCIKAPMQHLSIVLTDILQPLLIDKNIPSFIFDSNQLLYRLHKLGKIPINCTLISSDVSALYPSIPHVEGFRAMNNFLHNFTLFNSQQIDSIIRALELVITENFMIWNSQIYKQSSGVAMGTPVAVAYANIFMHWVDSEVRKKAAYIHEHIRYIDDNLFIVPEDKVEHLMEVANNILPPHIKFTYEKLERKEGTEKGLPFLDTQLFIGEDYSIESRLYTKATDRHAYLLPSSYHPPHVTKNIPLAVFGRLRKICSREDWFVEDTQKAVSWLENRGYKKGDIQKALDKARCKDRWGMIEKIEKNRDKKRQNIEEVEIDIPLILTYNQHVSKIRKVLKDRQPLLNSAFRRTKVRPRLSFRRRRNLNDIVVQKGLRGPIEVQNREGNIFTKCGESPGYRTRCPCRGRHRQDLCRCCMHSREVIESIEYKLWKPVSCNTKNVIYVIGCSECSKKYVGETQQRLKDRLAQHMYNVAKLNQPLYLHFRQVHKLESMYIGIVEVVRGVEPFMRKVREAWWINKLKTLEPSGFNVKLECNQVYEETG